MAEIPGTEESAPYDPQWLEAENQMGGRVTISTEKVEDCRAQFAALFAGVAPFLPKPTGAVQAKDVQISASQRIRVYIPAGVSQSLPVGLYIHSGGWYTGSIEAEDFLCRLIAEKSQIILFSPDYRLAPENPYPAGLEDCFKAYEFMHATASKYGGDPKRKFIMGGSAGGGLAASVGLKYTSNPEMKPAGLILACVPTCDPKALPEEYKRRHRPDEYRGTPMIDDTSLQLARTWYNVPRPEDPLYSTLLHPDIKLLPRMYFAAPTKDPTYQETTFFFEECKKQHVEAELVEWVGWPHCFYVIPTLPKSAEFMEVWNDKLKLMIAAAQ